MELDLNLNKFNIEFNIPRQHEESSKLYANKERLEEELVPVNDEQTLWVPKDADEQAEPIEVIPIPSVDVSTWSDHKTKFAAAFAVYCQLKELEGYRVPTTLDINLFEQYYPLLAEDCENMSSVIEALWAEYSLSS